MAESIHTKNWAATPMGPVEAWPPRLRAILDVVLASPNAIVLFWGPDAILIYNDAYARLIGARHPGALGRPAWELFADIVPNLESQLVDIWSGKPEQVYSLRTAAPGNVQMDVSYSPIPDENGNLAGILGIVPETAAARLENDPRLAFLLRLSDNLSRLRDPIAIQAAAARCLGEHLGANRVVYINIIDEKEAIIDVDFAKGVASMTGRYSADFFGCGTLAKLRSGDAVIINDVASDPELDDRDRQTFVNAEIGSCMMAGIVKNSRLPAALGAHYAKPRVWTGFEIGLLRDTAERTWAAVERARASLIERGTLVRQVHHRVKNDLQLITSLLNLQAEQVEDSRVLSILEKSRNRVYSIATVYELIHRSQEQTGVNMAAYTSKLVPELVRFHHATKRIEIRMEVDPVTMELERAVPLGLLLNELVSNACIHAFPPGRHGAVTIRFGREDHQYHLVVADNGAGFPVGFDFHQASSLGLRLVQMLARQLGGEVDMVPASGAHIRLQFPVTRTVENETL